MRTKSRADNSQSKDDVNYTALMDEGLRELKELRKQIERDRAKCVRLRASSQRKIKETREILRRVEANF
ncbi:MAG: hypothetical protein ACXW3Z_05200 [Limisphaerales bacterium]